MSDQAVIQIVKETELREAEFNFSPLPLPLKVQLIQPVTTNVGRPEGAEQQKVNLEIDLSNVPLGYVIKQAIANLSTLFRNDLAKKPYNTLAQHCGVDAPYMELDAWQRVKPSDGRLPETEDQRKIRLVKELVASGRPEIQAKMMIYEPERWDKLTANINFS